uniref:Integrase, catalytic region, zinc finger, CCHC-type, peptidase aspartic, catalytic n=1 Tax=Tanacetum cinerariifolium TaxID=118510 RepID=A0A6L2KES8_TANCI|nr:hypothetical protein [Tanacetum cinerariifolium]
MILESVVHGLLIWHTVEENRVIRTKKYAELSAAEKIQADCDMKATNIILQDLHTANFDQLYAYLEQHELHANKVRLLRERHQDPLAFIANQQMTPPHFKTYQSSYYNPQLNNSFHHLKLLNMDQFITLNITHPLIHHTSTQSFISLAVPVFSPRDDPIACLNKLEPLVDVETGSGCLFLWLQQIRGVYCELHDGLILLLRYCELHNGLLRSQTYPPPSSTMATPLYPHHLPFILVTTTNTTDPSSSPHYHHQDLTAAVNITRQPRVRFGLIRSKGAFGCCQNSFKGRQGQSYSGTGYKSDATSSEGNNASGHARDKAMLAEAQKARQILDEEQLAFLADLGVPDGQAVQTIIPNNAAFQIEDLDTYDSDCDDISNAKAVLMANIFNYDSDVISEVPHSSTYLNDDMENQSVHAMQDFGQSPVVDFTDNEIHSDSNIILLSEDFGKRFTPQQELSAEQAFWFRISNPTIESSNKTLIKVEVPSELPKVSLVNASLKKIKFHLAQFDSVVKKRTTHDARTKDIFNVFDKDLLNEIMEVRTIFDQMEAVVQYSLVDKQCLEIAKKELFLENDRLLQQIMSQDVLLTMMNSMSLIEFKKNDDMKAQIQEKDTTIRKLKEIIKSTREMSKEENVNYDYCEIETKNVELEKSVEKLLLENERL